MEKIVINEGNLKEDSLNEIRGKVRALLIDDFNNILIVDYGDLYLFPGGTIDSNEKIGDAIIRELSEETGEKYEIHELEPLALLSYYQKNYPKRDGTYKNRLINTYYFVAKSKGIDYEKQKLTHSEISGGFKLKYVPLEDIETIFNKSKTDNPRNEYFREEFLKIIEYYKSLLEKEKTKVK